MDLNRLAAQEMTEAKFCLVPAGESLSPGRIARESPFQYCVMHAFVQVTQRRCELACHAQQPRLFLGQIAAVEITRITLITPDQCSEVSAIDALDDSKKEQISKFA